MVIARKVDAVALATNTRNLQSAVPSTTIESPCIFIRYTIPHCCQRTRSGILTCLIVDTVWNREPGRVHQLVLFSSWGVPRASYFHGESHRAWVCGALTITDVRATTVDKGMNERSNNDNKYENIAIFGATRGRSEHTHTVRRHSYC